MTDQTMNSDDLDFGLREILATVWRRKSAFLWSLAACVGAALVLLMLVTPRYRAEALILIEPQEAQAAIVEPAATGLLRDAEAVLSETYVLTSSAMVERVVDIHRLQQDPEFNPALAPKRALSRMLCNLLPVSAVPAMLDCNGSHPEPAVDPRSEALNYSRIVDRFERALDVNALSDSRVISVRFTSTDPLKAQAITNTIAGQYLELREEAKFESAYRVTAWLNEQIADLRGKVMDGESAIEALRRERGLIEGDRGSLQSQEVGQVSSQLVIARAARAEAAARLGQVQVLLKSDSGAITASEVLDSPLIQRLRAQQTELQGRVAELSAELGDKHPRMLQLRAEAREIQTEIDAEIAKIVTGLRNQLAVAEARERSFENALAEIKSRAATANEDQIEIRTLERDVEANRALLTSLLARQTQTAPQGDAGYLQADARIISSAALPTRPAFPNKSFVLGFAVFGSLVLGGLAVIVLELLDGGFRSIEELDQLNGVPALAFIPDIRSLGKQADAYEFLLANPSSAYADAVRTLHWSISLARQQAPPKTVLVTSSLPNEGKSTIASSLAITQAQSGRKTLLIDADIRQPSIHEIFDVERRPGLAEYLTGQVELSDVIRSDRSGIGVSIITTGSLPQDVPNLLASARMKQLLDAIRSSYELIIVDSPPVMVGADVRLLCGHVDATVLAVRWGRTPRRTVRLSLRNLQSSGATLAGTVLSMVNVKQYAKYSYGDSGAYTGELAKYYVR